MSDNIPSSNKRTRWKNKWKKKKKSQVTLQNNNATDTQQHVRELCVNGADFTPTCSSTIKIGIHSQVTSYRASEGSSFRSTAAVTQLHQRDEASQAMHRTVTNPLSDKSTGWKKKRKKKQKKKQQATADKSNNMTSTQQDSNKPLFNGADFTLGRTIVFHPRVSSDSDVSSQSTAAIRHSQGNTSSTTRPNCETTTLIHISPPFSAPVRPPNKPADSKTHFPSAVAGPSSRHSSSQRPVSSFSSAGVPSKYLAIDCEMVGTGPKGSISQLARCSIVSYDGDVVYDKFVRPPMPITDYRTRWSGIRARDLHGATPYAEARKEILKLLKGKVLIGHAIHNDLKVLNYCLAKDFIRDTSRIPLLNIKAGFNEREVVSLKRLTKALFNRDIQAGRTGHSSVEDAKATMELYKLVEVDWERTLASTAKNCQGGNK